MFSAEKNLKRGVDKINSVQQFFPQPMQTIFLNFFHMEKVEADGRQNQVVTASFSRPPFPCKPANYDLYFTHGGR